MVQDNLSMKEHIDHFWEVLEELIRHSCQFSQAP